MVDCLAPLPAGLPVVIQTCCVNLSSQRGQWVLKWDFFIVRSLYSFQVLLEVKFETGK